MLTMDATEGRLRRLMRDKGMSPADFAKTIKMDRTSFSNILNGISKPSLATLIKIANTHGVTLDWLCGGDYAEDSV